MMLLSVVRKGVSPEAAVMVIGGVFALLIFLAVIGFISNRRAVRKAKLRVDI